MTEPSKTERSASETPEAPRVRDKSVRPSGLLPKNIQAWMVLGIALVMILVIALSGNKSPREGASQPAAKAPSVIDPNEARIQEYRNRIDEDARKLAAEQERLRGAKEAVGLAASQATGSTTMPGLPMRQQILEQTREERFAQSPSSQSPIERDREKREYESLFASNISLSYRKSEIAGKEAAPSAGGPGQPMASLSESPYGLLPAIMSALSAPQPQAQAAGQQSGAGAPPAPPNPASGDAASKPAPPPAAPKSDRPDPGLHRIPEGSVLEAVLTNRISGGAAGPVNCMITTDVYSPDGRFLLIPRGSRALGEANRVDSFGQERLAVVFHRLILPDGYSIRLDRSPALDQAGETGLHDKIDNHFLRNFGLSIAIGALSGLTQYNTRYGLDQSSGDVYRQGVSRSLGDTSVRILDRYLNLPPSFTIREGHRVKIYLAADIFVPAYGDYVSEKSR